MRLEGVRVRVTELKLRSNWCRFIKILGQGDELARLAAGLKMSQIEFF